MFLFWLFSHNCRTIENRFLCQSTIKNQTRYPLNAIPSCVPTSGHRFLLPNPRFTGSLVEGENHETISLAIRRNHGSIRVLVFSRREIVWYGRGTVIVLHDQYHGLVRIVLKPYPGYKAVARKSFWGDTVLR